MLLLTSILLAILLATILIIILVVAFHTRTLDDIILRDVRATPVESSAIIISVVYPEDVNLEADPSIFELISANFEGVLIRMMPYTNFEEVITRAITGSDVIIGGITSQEIITWWEQTQALNQITPLFTPLVSTRYFDTDIEFKTNLFRYQPNDCSQLMGIIDYYLLKYDIQLTTELERGEFINNTVIIVDRSDPYKVQSLRNAARHVEFIIMGGFHTIYNIRVFEVDSSEDLFGLLNMLDANLVIMSITGNRNNLIPTINNLLIPEEPDNRREIILMNEAYRHENTVNGIAIETAAGQFKLYGNAITRNWGNGVYTFLGRDLITDSFYQALYQTIDIWRGGRFRGTFSIPGDVLTTDGWLPSRSGMLISQRGERLFNFNWIPTWRVENRVAFIVDIPPGMEMLYCVQTVDGRGYQVDNLPGEISKITVEGLNFPRAMYKGEFGIGAAIDALIGSEILYFDTVKLTAEAPPIIFGDD